MARCFADYQEGEVVLSPGRPFPCHSLPASLINSIWNGNFGGAGGAVCRGSKGKNNLRYLCSFELFELLGSFTSLFLPAVD